jgi:hypothetical protein
VIEQQQQQHAWLHLYNIPFLLLLFFERFILSENHRLVFSSSSIHPVIKRKQDEPFEQKIQEREGLGSFSWRLSTAHTGLVKDSFPDSSYNKQGSRHFSTSAPTQNSTTTKENKKSDKKKRNTPRIGKKCWYYHPVQNNNHIFSFFKKVVSQLHVLMIYVDSVIPHHDRMEGADSQRTAPPTTTFFSDPSCCSCCCCKERINKTWPHFHRLWWWWWPTVLWPAPTYI